MKNLKFLLIGKNGQLGWELQKKLPGFGAVFAFDFPEIDLAKPENVRGLIKNFMPNVIINAAAYTNVDKAESEKEIAMAINAAAPKVMAEEAKRIGAAFIHYSTDYVFDGTKHHPYIETDDTNPLNVYGSSKLAGEQLVQEVGGASIILRTSWVYNMRQGGFVTKVLQWARQQETLRVVDDQISCPTWSRVLTDATIQIISDGSDSIFDFISQHGGLYHLAGKGSCSRFEWAKAIIAMDPKKEQQKVKEILAAKSSDFPTPAIRPEFSILDCTKFENEFSYSIPSWQLALNECIQKSNE